MIFNLIHEPALINYLYPLHAALQMSTHNTKDLSSESDTSKVLEDQSFMSSVIASVCELEPALMNSMINQFLQILFVS